MRYGVHVLVFGSIALFFGVAELFAPGLVLSSYGMSTDPGAVAVVRLAAAVMLSFGLTVVLSRRTTDVIAQRAVLLSGLAYGVVGGAVSVHLALTDAANSMIWTNLLIDVPLVGNATRLLVALRGSPRPSGAKRTLLG